MPLRVGCRVDVHDKHEFNVDAILYHQGVLYSTGDDGKIKAFTPDLTKLAEVQAKKITVNSIAASLDTLYCCSSDGTIKSFELMTLKEKGDIISDDKVEFSHLRTVGDLLFASDNEGNIKVWNRKVYLGFFKTPEPIKDFEITSKFCFSVKDNDVDITDFLIPAAPAGKLQSNTIRSFMGRAPITLIGDQYFAYLSRDGKDICINENNHDTFFKLFTEVKGAHVKPVNALKGATWNNKPILFSGGWDKAVKKWNIDSDMVKEESSIDLDFVVDDIALGDKGEIFVAGSDGQILRIEVE